MNVNISRYIGDPSDPHGHFIYGDIVSRVEATQGIYADVIAGPATNGGNSNVVTLAASGGSILGDIYAPAPDGSAQFLQPAGSVPPATPCRLAQ